MNEYCSRCGLRFADWVSARMERQMARKAVIEIGRYIVKEGPTGGWRVFEAMGEQPISIHDDKGPAIAAAKRYQASDVAWAQYNCDE